jgi:hypothetical protein
MSLIITPDSICRLKLKKDCRDFEPMDDHTVVGEWKYCAKSFDCRQIGYKSDYVQLEDPKTGKIINHEYLCCGILFQKNEMEIDEVAR